MQMKKTVSLMYAGLLLIGAAVLCFGSWSLWLSWQNSVRATEKEAKNQSLSLSRQAQDTFLQVQLTLEELARNADAVFSAPARFDGPQGRLARQKAHLPQLSGLFIYDAQGNWLAGTGLDAAEADKNYILQLTRHSATQPYIGHAMRSRITGQWLIPVSLRLNDAQGALRGVALATVNIDFFRHFYSWYELGEGGLLGLLHSDGTIFYIRPFSDRVINRRIANSPLFTQMLTRARSGTHSWKNRVDGKERIVGYAQAERYPLVAVAGYDRQALAQTWLQNNRTIIILNILLLLMVLLSGVLGIRQLRKTVARHIELMKAQDELTRANHTLQDLALLDGLTGIGNRRQFDIYLEQCLTRAAQTGTPVTLVMLDIDYFKNYNDTYGHVAGDECLKKVASILKNLPRRSTDIVTRYGGEEFAIILPSADTEQAEHLARHALDILRSLALPHKATRLPEKMVTLSVGISTSEADSDSVSLKQAADTALYAAKYAGRNRIVTTRDLWSMKTTDVTPDNLQLLKPR